MIYRFLQILVILGIILSLASKNVSAAPSVTIYGSGTYSDTSVTLSIYSTTTDCSLMSFGVLLHFNPADVTADSVTRNETIWYMGDGITNAPYMAPTIDAGGYIKMIGGRLDTANPTAGVNGADILLGQITFTRVSVNVPTMTLAFAEGGTYINFRTVAFESLDTTPGGVVFDPVNLVQVDPDTDGDGVPDVSDDFPTDPAASVDTDSDGYPDAWNPGKTKADSTTGLTLDAFPNDPLENTDTDGDGEGNNSDPCPDRPPIHILGKSDHWQGLQWVYDFNMVAFDTVQAQSTYVNGPLVLDQAKEIAIQGGFDCDFLDNTGTSTVIESLTIDNLSDPVTIENIVIK